VITEEPSVAQRCEGDERSARESGQEGARQANEHDQKGQGEGGDFEGAHGLGRDELGAEWLLWKRAGLFLSSKSLAEMF
jgi:hypothetical protein